ncbi:MAG: hypothetical protein O9312_03425 [Hylemonella sp.]|nr:hypothetical protein [Hylemonella sp.]
MGCYIDTTIVCAVADDLPNLASTSKQHIDANQPGAIPYYALRELVAGPLKTLCAAHSLLARSESIADAFRCVMNLPPIVGRTKQGQLSALIQTLGQCLTLTPTDLAAAPRQPIDDPVRRKMTHNLAINIQRQWSLAKRIPNTKTSHQLACFADGDFDFNETGELKGPNGRFQCDPSQPCSAAAHLRGKLGEVQTLVDVLHPSKLTPELADKRENVRRRGALKEVIRLQKGERTSFPKKDCRALGDAYFAVMCPPGSHVLTTNFVDHDLLCTALGKTAIKP